MDQKEKNNKQAQDQFSEDTPSNSINRDNELERAKKRKKI